MKARVAWMAVIAIISAASLASVLAVVLFDGSARILFAISAILFAVCAVLVFSSRKKYLEILDRNSTVDCLRLKRPGVVADIRGSEEIIPKGKMPSESTRAGIRDDVDSEGRITEGNTSRGRIPPE